MRERKIFGQEGGVSVFEALKPEVRSVTPRQLEVLELVARGINSNGVAEKLGISQDTVASHLGKAYAKLGTSSALNTILVLIDSKVLDIDTIVDEVDVSRSLNLTGAECEVMDALIENCGRYHSYKEIAKKTERAHSTVAKHVQRTTRKLGAQNLTQAGIIYFASQK